MYDDYWRVGKPNESFTQFRFPSTFCVHEEAHKFEFSNRERQENAPTKRSYFTSPLNVRLNQMSSVVFFGRKIQWMRKGKSTPRRKKKENFFYVHSIPSPPTPSPNEFTSGGCARKITTTRTSWFKIVIRVCWWIRKNKINKYRWNRKHFSVYVTHKNKALLLLSPVTVKGKYATSFLIFSVRFDVFECLLFKTIAISKKFLFRAARWLLCKKRIDMWSRAAEREIQSLIYSFPRAYFRLMMMEKKSRERPWGRSGIYR